MSLLEGANKLSKSVSRIGFNAKTLGVHGLQWALGPPMDPAVRLRHLFESLGTTYIKLGQFIASAPSFFPAEYVKAFQNCLDKTPPLPFATIEKVINAELKTHWKTKFEWIDPTPLACASIAQVHAAKTSTGQDVVLKVQKPNVEHILKTDLNFLLTSAVIAEKLAPHMKIASLADICKEIKNGMLAECDFLLELQNLENFRTFIHDHGFHQVTAPKPLHELSTRRLLTMERLYGVPFTDLEAVKHLVDDPQSALIHGMNAWFATLLEGHHFHADVHAGNLLVLEDGRVAFIDFGIVGHVSKNTWNAVQTLIESMMEHNSQGIASALYEIGMTKNTIDLNAFAQSIEKILLKPASNLDAVNPQNQSIDQKILELSQIAQHYGLHFPREFALLMKQLLYFDRYVQLVSDDLDAFNPNFYQDQRLAFF